MNTTTSMYSTMSACETPGVRRFQWIWWTFTLYYFIPVYYMPFKWLNFSLMMLAFAAFIALSIMTARIEPSKIWRPIAALVVLAIITTPLTPGSSTFFTYAGFFAGFCFTTRQFFISSVALLTIVAGLHFAHNYPFPYFALPAVMGVVTIGLIGVIERTRCESKIKEQQSHQEIRQLAVIAERERIARDLHDLLGHTLSSIALKAELAEKLLTQENYAEGKKHLLELNKIARDSLSLVRQTVSGYKHRGLVGEVMSLCDKLREKNIIVTLHGEIPKLTVRTETALILALTELTTNVLRHSKGTACDLTFEQSKEHIKMTLCDNGKVNEIKEGNGLNGIRERLNALAGQLDITCEDQCCFIITLPAHEIVSEINS